MNIENLVATMRANGATRLLAKRLAPNDNAKNQIYLGGDYSAIQLIPFGGLHQDTRFTAGSRRARMKASVDFSWITETGHSERAIGANLILYPRYPEVRLSGVLRGVRDRHPSSVVATRDEGRWLFLGITAGGRILAYAVHRHEACAREAEHLTVESPELGVFREMPFRPTARPDVMAALLQISAKGWIDSKRLDRDGHVLPCNSRNCGGYTLEAELGIRPNGRADPDYDGWEVKQFEVGDLDDPRGGRVTLMTPEPNGGLYADEGPEQFLRRYGYPDRSGIPDRINFGGVHRFGRRHPVTGLCPILSGWDADSCKMTSVDGGIELVDASGAIAARWSFETLLNHWKRKHAKAVYVPSNCAVDPRRYRYGHRVLAGVGTEFPLLLQAFARGLVFYDPGIKVENASTRPEVKRRSQFRIQMHHIDVLYQSVKWLNLRER